MNVCQLCPLIFAALTWFAVAENHLKQLDRNHQSILSRTAKAEAEVRRFTLLISFVHQILVCPRCLYSGLLLSYVSLTVTWFSHMQFYLISHSVFPPTSIATIHESSSRPNWRLRGRSLLRVPGDRRPQAEGQLEQEGQKGQLATHRGEWVHHAGV